MKYIEHQFNELETFIDKHDKTLEERNSQKEFYSEFHRLLDTKYIVHHQEFVEFKGSLEFKRMDEKARKFHTDRWKKSPDRYKAELDNYEKNRSVDENLHKALDGLYNSEKLRLDYACRLIYLLTSDWNDPRSLANARQAYKDRKKY